MTAPLDRRVTALEAATETDEPLDISSLTQQQRAWLRPILEDLVAGRLTRAEAEARYLALCAGESRPDSA